jgi:dTDP-4-amino-4,6-dideoxygalactose transaminase
MIEFLDLREVNEAHGAAIRDAVERVLRSGWYILGEETQAFEAEFAAYSGARHCIGVGNGLDALSLSLRGLGIGPGDEVIVPSNTFIATWLAVSHVGATPVPVEPDACTFNLDPARIEAALTPRTRAIVPVHLYGQPADLAPILALARSRGLRVVEDAAQAHGARYRGRRLGAHGDAVAWSFYPGKNLGALGDGGAITTDDDELAARLRLLRHYGSSVKYHHDLIGFNTRLDELQAAVLRVKLRSLDADNARRAEVANAYRSGLDGADIELPGVPDWADPVWHLFVVRHPRRDDLARRLLDAGVRTVIHYPVSPHLQPAYRSQRWPAGSFPVAERLQREVLSLPMSPCLSAGDVQAVIRAVGEAADILARTP